MKRLAFAIILLVGAGAAPADTSSRVAGSWRYEGADADIRVNLKDNGECLVIASRRRDVGRFFMAECVYSFDGPRVTLNWTGPAAEQRIEPMRLTLASDGLVMRIEGEAARLLRRTAPAPITMTPKERELSGWELRARWEAFFECEGMPTPGIVPPRRNGAFIEIEIGDGPWKASTLFIDPTNGSIRWQHSRKAECRRAIDLEPT